MAIARGPLSLCVLLAGLGSASLALIGCGDDGSTGGGGQGGGEGGGTPANGPTFYKDVLPILQRSCLGCHSEGRIAGFSLGTYEEAKSQAGVMAAVTESGLMPPWHAIETDECQPPQAFVGDPRLPAEEIALLRAWDDAGAPEGDPADAPENQAPPSLDLTDADLEITPNEASIIEGENDQFVCVVYDPELTGERFIDAIHIVPGNQKVAHHALLFRVNRADLNVAEERFECFGAPQGDLIHAWAPGGVPLELPDDVGMPLDESHLIVVQMHYHPTGTTVEEDSSTVQIRFTEEEPSWEFQIQLPGNQSSAPGLLPDPDDRNGTPEFRIPAGVENHVEQMVIPVPAEIPIPIPILMVATHMHYVGVDARFYLERPNPTGDQPAEECFVHTPAWDFNWQRGYMYDAPIASLPTVTGGDILRLECRYNNSMSNRFVREALEAEGLSAPQDVFLGEQTLDEMCLGVIGFLVPRL